MEKKLCPKKRHWKGKKMVCGTLQLNVCIPKKLLSGTKEEVKHLWGKGMISISLSLINLFVERRPLWEGEWTSSRLSNSFSIFFLQNVNSSTQ